MSTVKLTATQKAIVDLLPVWVTTKGKMALVWIAYSKRSGQKAPGFRGWGWCYVRRSTIDKLIAKGLIVEDHVCKTGRSRLTLA